MQKVLITGATGFAGSHLVDNLGSKNLYKLYGTYLSEDSISNVEYAKENIELIKIDLTQGNRVTEIIQKIKPDAVFHLAALPSPAKSFQQPLETIMNNVSVQLNILEAIRQENLTNTRVLVVSSADVYGMVSPKDIPIDEETPLMPTSSYAVSKITQDFLGIQYFISYGLQIIRVRPFNHIGPRQSPSFVVSSFAKQIAEIEKGKREAELEVGNLNTRRDFTDVRDVVEAYSLILEKGKIGDVYNIGSGVSHKISEILDQLLALSKVKIKITVKEALFRPGDVPNLVCDNKKIVEVTGWKPTIGIEQTLKDTLDYWRNIV